MKISPHFTYNELKCHGTNCCDATCAMDSNFMMKLESIRKAYGKPMYPTCGFRCNKHNTDVGGVNNSRHTFGCAVDITLKDRDYDKLADIARNYLDEVIIYTDRNFIHLGME